MKAIAVGMKNFELEWGPYKGKDNINAVFSNSKEYSDRGQELLAYLSPRSLGLKNAFFVVFEHIGLPGKNSALFIGLGKKSTEVRDPKKAGPFYRENYLNSQGPAIETKVPGVWLSGKDRELFSFLCSESPKSYELTSDQTCRAIELLEHLM